MKQLLYKELRLVMHPMNVVFLFLSAILIIPNYPYLVMFFFTTLGIFMMTQIGRENHDIEYTMALPIRKRDTVRARFCFIVAIELLQMILAAPFAILRQSFDMPGNQVGMDANIALFAFAFVLYGIFNLVFLTRYYRNPDKVGAAFIWSNVAVWAYIIVEEVCVHIIPFMCDQLDTPDSQFLLQKLLTLGVGALLFLLLTLLAYRRSVCSFEALDG